MRREVPEVSDFLEAASGVNTRKAPIWLMRQAGRYLPEFIELKKRYGFWRLCSEPELAAEVTLQPVRRFGVDAAILFSDIMTPVPAMGMKIEFAPGPVIADPVRSLADVRALGTPARDEIAPFVGEAISAIRESSRVPLIGFAGAPLTVALYLVEGGTGGERRIFRNWLQQNPQAAHLLLEKLTTVITEYLTMQVEAGAQAIQIFDSWAGLLDAETYAEFSLPYVARILTDLNGLGVSRHYTAINAHHLLRDVAGLPADVIGVDWRTPLAVVKDMIGGRTVQGNLDPCVLNAPLEVITAKARHVLKQGLGGPHIFNLGHGVDPDTPPAHVLHLVDVVHEFDRHAGDEA